LQQRDASPSGKESANRLIVTLPTPFIEVHQADFGRRPMYIRLALLAALMCLCMWSLIKVDIVGNFFEVPAIVVVLAVPLLGVWWIERRATARQKRLDALKDATRLGGVMSGQQSLVIRAIDDEASLVMALGAILNYVIARSITYVLWIVFVLGVLNVLRLFPVMQIYQSFDRPIPEYLFWASAELAVSFFVLIFALLGALMVSRSVHGRELAVSPMECQINTQSAPDAVGLLQIVTLVSRSYVKSLRHGIYEHEDCAKTISDWIHSQLGCKIGHELIGEVGPLERKLT
jgi:hypothetical protein